MSQFLKRAAKIYLLLFSFLAIFVWAFLTLKGDALYTFLFGALGVAALMTIAGTILTVIAIREENSQTKDNSSDLST